MPPPSSVMTVQGDEIKSFRGQHRPLGVMLQAEEVDALRL
jgi:hypothetical protein